MNITSVQYYTPPERNENIGIKMVVNDILHFVPLDPSNTDYAEIMRQVEAGTLTIAPADEE